MSNIQFNFKRESRTFYPGEKIFVTLKSNNTDTVKCKDVEITVYCVLITSSDPIKYENSSDVILKSAGTCVLEQLIPTKGHPSVIDSSYSFDIEFEIPSIPGILESYRGRHMLVAYGIEFSSKKGVFSQGFSDSTNFVLLLPPSPVKPSGPPIDEQFNTNDSESPMIIDFNAKIYLESPVVSLQSPPVGYVSILTTKDSIDNITCSFLRLETIVNESGKRMMFDSIVSTVTVAENDPLLGRKLPFCLEWKKEKLCPSLIIGPCQLSYAVRIHIKWECGATATYDIPIILYRDCKY